MSSVLSSLIYVPLPTDVIQSVYVVVYSWDRSLYNGIDGDQLMEVPLVLTRQSNSIRPSKWSSSNTVGRNFETQMSIQC